MKLFHTDRIRLPLPPDHRFPESKYRILRGMVEERLVAHEGLLHPTDLVEGAPASDPMLQLVHHADYVRAVSDGSLPAAAWRRIGIPWSPELVERSRRSVGATVAACRAALEDGLAVHLGGGTHHAFADRGEGYCVFNDVAVALRALQAERAIARAVIVDCDVHQGNGTASIFAGDGSVFTFSIHGARNFPFNKVDSDLDVALPDGADDAIYLAELERALDRVLGNGVRFDLAVYLSGADAWEGDRLGRLRVTGDGMATRDRLVFDALHAAGLPHAVVMGGGYARDPADSARIYFQTVRLAAERAQRPR